MKITRFKASRSPCIMVCVVPDVISARTRNSLSKRSGTARVSLRRIFENVLARTPHFNGATKIIITAVEKQRSCRASAPPNTLVNFRTGRALKGSLNSDIIFVLWNIPGASLLDRCCFSAAFLMDKSTAREVTITKIPIKKENSHDDIKVS